jgi:hypothetical protein
MGWTAWAAAGFGDKDLSFLRFLELYRTDVAERRMAPGRVVKPLDEIGQWLLCGRPSHWQSVRKRPGNKYVPKLRTLPGGAFAPAQHGPT